MKILICTNHSYMFWRFRRELTEALLENHEVLISTPFVGHEDDLAALGCRMIETAMDRRGLNPLKDLKLFRFYCRLLKQEKPDLVITYAIKSNIYCGYACRMMGIPYCVNVQGLGSAFQKPWLAPLAKWMYRMALKKAKTTFFENVGNAEEFVRYRIQNAAKQTILPGAGVNVEYYSYTPYPRNDRLHFLYCGRLMKEKGIDELFWAVRKLHAEGEAFVLDLIGFYEDEYKEQVERLTADKIAVFHGFCSDPRPFYAATDCVILPSHHEGMSNVLLEASAIGRPVITNAIHGCMEAVEDGVNGYLTEWQNREDLYEKMKKMLQKSTEEREIMGKAGRERMVQHFHKDFVVGKTMEKLMSQTE